MSGKFVCRIAIVDDVRDQAELTARRLIKTLDERKGDRRRRLQDVVFSVSILAPFDGDNGEVFWAQCLSELSGKVDERTTTLWSNDTDEEDRANTSSGYHAIISDLFFDHLTWSSPAKNGIDLLRLARRRHPEIFTALITVATSEELDELDKGAINWMISKESMTVDRSYIHLCKSIDKSIEERLESPFWDGLRSYADDPKLVLHAMAAADGQSLANSITTADYLAFYGHNYFAAEASLTLPPLDSLLSPSGSIKRSQELYARAFGAKKARFSTNGTSAANSILGQALCSRGDYSLIDQNCHISHHYSYARCGVTPVFLEAEHISDVDEYGSIDPANLSKTLDNAITAQKQLTHPRLPTLIIITNCTFDGVAVRPDHYVNAVIDTLEKHNIGERLGEICFIFDEAWWGFARFDPRLIEYTAMYQVDRLRRQDATRYKKLRAYATHSTHKTLSSFRQTSAILISDPEFDQNPLGDVPYRFEQSFLAHTTTSPHAGMIASFDIARRQAVLDGSKIISASLEMAGKFKTWLSKEKKKGTNVGRLFRIVDDQELLGTIKDLAIVDPTKLTMEIAGNISGPQFKKELWESQRIQFNKYSRRRCLLMFTIGFSIEELENLKSRLTAFANENFESIDATSEILEIPKRLTVFAVVCEDGNTASFPAGLGQNKSWKPGDFLFGERVGELRSATLTITEIRTKITNGEIIVSGSFITPYPPGFPVIYPGQVLTIESLSLIPNYPDVEIHGQLTMQGTNYLRVFL